MPGAPWRTGSTLAVSSNKGGVGKTTLSTNLAIYIRALRESIPVLLVSLDDQGAIDRMLALRKFTPADGNLKHGWSERSFERVIQLGNYGVHFVPSARDVLRLKARAEDPTTLRRILDRTAWDGLVILDTKSDLEALTCNAIHAADRVIIPISDWASLEEADREIALLRRSQPGADKARVVFTLVDRRTRAAGGGEMVNALRSEVRRRGWPTYRTWIARSPRVEALTAGSRVPRSILHEARGTRVHQQMRDLAEEVISDLKLDAMGRAREGSSPPRVQARAESSDRGVGDWKTALLKGLRGRAGSL